MSDINIVVILVIAFGSGFLGWVVGVVVGALFLGHLFHPDDQARDDLARLEAQYDDLLELYHAVCDACIEES